MNRSAIINAIHSEFEDSDNQAIPIDVFPLEIQNIIHDLARYENYNVEYVIASLLSAAASAIGNSYHIRIKSEWVSSPCLYFLLVGRPGLGKTPPVNFSYGPLRINDEIELKKYEIEMKLYENYQKTAEKKDKTINSPKLKRCVISDFTPEALLYTHYNNPRGISVVVDEILALFKSIGRYSAKSNLIETLLSAYSGQPLDSIRKAESCPIYIKMPCVNIIGTIQTKLIGDIIGHEYSANGLIDRLLFVYPLNRKIRKWTDNNNDVNHIASKKWKSIIDSLLNLKCNVDSDGNVSPSILNMSDEAYGFFIHWYNNIIDTINSVEDDECIESRMVKQDNKVARFALIIQLLRWATDESTIECVDIQSVQSAIRLVDYFEASYYRILDEMKNCDNSDRCNTLYTCLPNSFKANDALVISAKLGISERSTYDYLNQLCSMYPPKLQKTGQRKSAVYMKI